MRVAVLGYGTVGIGVYEMLKSAVGLEPGPVLVREGKAREAFHVTSLDEILSDPDVGAVVEAMGGVEPAYRYAREVLLTGRHFVTSNKVLVAAKGPELAALARDHGAAFLFSAACGGGVPLLHNLSVATKSDEILSVSGILNGTTNYMLYAMQSRGLDYGEALKMSPIWITPSIILSSTSGTTMNLRRFTNTSPKGLKYAAVNEPAASEPMKAQNAAPTAMPAASPIRIFAPIVIFFFINDLSLPFAICL